MRSSRETVLSLALLGFGCGEDAAPGQPRSDPAVAGSTGATSAGVGNSAAGVSGGTGGEGASGGTSSNEQLSDCALDFPYREQAPRGHWLGADSNFSLALSPTHALMTFQDSFVGGSQSASRSGSAMVGNSVATITCEAGKYAIDYHWGGTAQSHGALFDEQKSGERLWIHRPWLYAGRLFLTATRVTSDEQGFSEGGMTLARVANPLEPPEAWSIEYFDLTDQRVTVGKGIAETEQYVYLFTPYQADMILVRIAKDRLLEATISGASLDYLVSDGTWAMGLVPARAKKLGLPANTGLTLRYHAASERWLSLFTDTSAWPSAAIAISFAEALEGPWSKPTPIYSVPEMNSEAPEYDADTICYGASEHVSFNADPDAKLLFTYTCNSNQFSKLLADLAIYVPRVVQVPMP
jgi:hypothetical protein